MKSKGKEIRIHNTQARVINLPDHGRYKPRLLPGTNKLPAEYWERIMSPVKVGGGTVDSPTKRCLVDTGVLKVLDTSTPDQAAKVDPAMPPQNEESVPSPDSLVAFSDLDAFAHIAGEDDPDKLAAWGKELHEAGKPELVEAIVARLQGMGYNPEQD